MRLRLTVERRVLRDVFARTDFCPDVVHGANPPKACEGFGHHLLGFRSAINVPNALSTPPGADLVEEIHESPFHAN
jgi:hypothetical protein